MVKQLTDLIDAHEKSHRDALDLMERFNEILITASLRRRAGEFNQLSQVERLIHELAAEVLPHLRQEEENLYPYLSSHVPKLEPVVKYLIAEHQDLRERLHEVFGLLESLTGPSGKLNRERNILKLQQLATYLVFLFRNHLRAEREGLFRVVEDTLKPDEKAEVLNLL